MTCGGAVYAPSPPAFQGGHVYGRHLYDGNGLARALQEAEWLHEQGIIGGVVITEAGLNGGYGYVGDEAWLAWTAQLDEQLREQPLIIGACLWTLGDWNGANWQTALPGMTAYLAANPSSKWSCQNPTEPEEPPTSTLTRKRRRPHIFLEGWRRFQRPGLRCGRGRPGAASYGKAAGATRRWFALHAPPSPGGGGAASGPSCRRPRG